MTPMTADGKTETTLWLISTWNWLRENKIVRIILLLRWLISISLTLAALAWGAYVLGQDISENLTNDYKSVQNAQSTLLDDVQKFRDDLLNPNITLDLTSELAELRKKAVATIAALGGLRAPSNTIDLAKQQYSEALQQLVGVANRLSRGEIQGMAAPLHNTLQTVSNSGGNLNREVSRFQGGMWPQLKAAIF